ncbi:hypothetical protein D9M68_712890 [compost metagenome]
MVIQPGLQVGAVDAQTAAGLLKQREGVGARFLGQGEAFQWQVFAKDERRRFSAFAIGRRR